MGVLKSGLKINEIPILQLLHAQLMWPGPTILVDAPGRDKPPGYERFEKVVTDPVTGEGPLRGILTAMERSSSPLLVVIPVDMPCMRLEALSTLVDALQNQSFNSMAMFQREGKLEPLPVAFVVSQARPVIQEQLKAGKASIYGLAEVMNAAVVCTNPSWPENLWVNLNRPADVEEYLQLSCTGVAS